MNITIKNCGDLTLEEQLKPSSCTGLKRSFRLDGRNGLLIYKVVNKQLFMLTVIRYGIEFEECKD